MRRSQRAPKPKDLDKTNSRSSTQDIEWFRRVAEGWEPEHRCVWLWGRLAGVFQQQQPALKRGNDDIQQGAKKKPRQTNVAATCRHSGCSARGSHGAPGTKEPVFCSKHGADGMIKVARHANSVGGDNGVVAPMDISGDSDGGGTSDGSATPMDIGGSGSSDGGGGGGSGGGRDAGDNGTVGDKEVRPLKPPGTTRVTGPDLAQFVTAPVLPCLERFLANNRKVSDDRAGKREGTATRAPGRPAGVGTVADIANPLALLSESSEDGIKIMEGVYFPRSKISVLQRHYQLDYVFDPSNIDVVVGETEVKWKGRTQKVAGFDHGVYTLENKKNTMTQWELLQNRCGDGVTLEQDLARYIRQLGLMYVVVKGQVVPHLTAGSNVDDGMLLDVDGGLDRAAVRGDKIDPVSNLGIDELRAIKSKADRVRKFSLRIFTTSSVRDLLPIPEASGEEGKRSKSAEDFVKRPGSLKELNCMPDLECFDQRGTTLSGHLFTGRVVRGGKGGVPNAKLIRGCWTAKLKITIRLLMCAYRLARPSNTIEAYHPLSRGELRILKMYHSFWGKNMAACYATLEFENMGKHIATEEQLDGENKWAYRLVVERSRTFLSYLTPVVGLACGTRDPFKYGTLSLRSLDTNHVMHTRVYDTLLRKLLEASPSLTPVLAVLKTSEGLFKESRNGRTERNADINGALGEGSKSRRNKLILLDDPVDRRFTLMMAFQMSLGEKVRPLMEAVLKHCPDFELLATICLVKAKPASSQYTQGLLPEGNRTTC